MKTYIVLLRGINVGGHKKVPMADLRELLKTSGFESVKTYIQSGNIILRTLEENRIKVENKIQKAIQDHFGFEVPVIAKTRDELKLIFDTCPFSEAEKTHSYFILLHKIPEPELVDAVANISFDNETFHILKDCLYFYSSVGYGRTKFNMNTFEKKLKVAATSRNYKTMIKLLELSL